ncbi:hypothetical protein PMAYCL1PPCAC_26482, partial [Pristionchus mayeri]
LQVMETGKSDCREMCSWVLSNLVEGGTKEQILSLWAEKPMPALSAVLSHTDHICISRALRVIYKLLSAVNGNQLDTIKEEAENSGVVGHLKNLQGNNIWYYLTFRCAILSEYFMENDDEETNEKLKRKSDEKADQNVQKRKR